MSTVPPSPLTPEHLANIKNGLDILTIAQQQIDLAKRAGIDVSRHQADVDDARQKLLQIKNTYFPGQ